MNDKYNFGLRRFIQAKKLEGKKAINAFLKHKNITDFDYSRSGKVNNFIEKNWNEFAGFCDAGIKSGLLKGKRVKLNTYYDELQEYIDMCKQEERDLNLTFMERQFIRYADRSKVQSFLSKNGVDQPKAYPFEYAKRLGPLPMYRKAIELGCKLWEHAKDYN